MKTIFTAAGGKVNLVEDGGVFTLNIDESVSAGGGQAAGLAEVKGQASVVLDVATGVQLGEKLLNSHLPASVQALE
jgi:hypothetical protein